LAWRGGHPAVSGRFLGRIIVRDRNSGDVRYGERRGGGERQNGNGSATKQRRKSDLRLAGRKTRGERKQRSRRSPSQHNNRNTTVPWATRVAH